MIAFLILSLMLVLAALIFVAAPLIRRRGGTVDRQAVDAIAVTRARALEELEQELEDGLIDNRTYELSRREIESEASDNQTRVESGQATHTGKPVSAIVLVILIPLLATLLYLQVGDPAAIEHDPAAAMDDMDMDEAVRQLEERLEARPDDLEGWMMLGRTRMALGEYDAAVEAYRQAVDLAGEDNPRVLADYAEAVSLADPSRMVTEAAPLFRHVLDLDPEHPKGLWYSGLIAFEEGEYDAAAGHWERLLAQDPPADFRNVVEDRLAAARAAAREEDDPEALEEAVENGAHVMLEVAVTDSLAESLTGDEAVFVIARSVEEAGGPPLAGIRLSVSALPGRFRLGDENAMLDGHQISGHEEIEVIARISRSGEATPQSGDLVGSRVLRVEDHEEEAAEILIDEVFEAP